MEDGKKASHGIRLVSLILQRSKKIITEKAEIDDNGDVETPDLETILEELLTEDDVFYQALQITVEEELENLEDQVTYELRAAWSDQREIERTDRAEWNLEKSRQL